MKMEKWKEENKDKLPEKKKLHHKKGSKKEALARYISSRVLNPWGDESVDLVLYWYLLVEKTQQVGL